MDAEQDIPQISNCATGPLPLGVTNRRVTDFRSFVRVYGAKHLKRFGLQSRIFRQLSPHAGFELIDSIQQRARLDGANAGFLNACNQLGPKRGLISHAAPRSSAAPAPNTSGRMI
ncbi:hypothetical protein [Novacetimonas hansenii]|uniref:hypothetical protein n=1 Tax=Novacetimonas hansenii TaxID=436 RepID=UPI0012BB0EB0|nr:hypothetical protein [Novacetimonas hansenii]